MNREWFLENKERYEREWVAPMTQLLDEVAAKLPAYKKLRVAEGHAPSIATFGSRRTSSRTRRAHRRVDLDGEGPHGAVHPPRRDRGVRRLRRVLHFEDRRSSRSGGKVVASGKGGEAIGKLVAEAARRGLRGRRSRRLRARGPSRTPPGITPRGELLKDEGASTGGFPAMPKGMLHKPGLVDWIRGRTHGKAMGAARHPGSTRTIYAVNAPATAPTPFRRDLDAGGSRSAATRTRRSSRPRRRRGRRSRSGDRRRCAGSPWRRRG